MTNGTRKKGGFATIHILVYERLLGNVLNEQHHKNEKIT